MKTQALLAAALLAGFLPVALPAQAPSSGPVTAERRSTALTGESQAPFALDSPHTITLDVTVTQKSGAPATGLTQSDFTVLNNKSPNPISAFRAVTPLQKPVEFILLIDAINTPLSDVSFIRRQLQEFLQANPRLPCPTSIGVLTDKGSPNVTGFTNDGKAIADYLAQLPPVVRTFNDTSGFYADQQRMQISLAAARQLTDYARTLPGHKIVIWISPGWPLLSASDTQIDDRMQKITYANIVDMAARIRQANLTFYTINPLGSSQSTADTFAYQQYLRGIDKPVNAKAGDLGLQVLSLQSGGLVFTGKTDVVNQLQQIFKDASSWYELTLAVPPGAHRNEYHQLQINLNQPGLTARSLTGYYAQP